MPGFVVKINNEELAAVSVEKLNILSIQVHGDVVGEELAELQIFGGNYEGKENDTHLIWVSEHEITSNDVIDVVFVEAVTTSYPGKTIDELHPESKEIMGPWQPIEEMFEYLSKKPKLRQKFSIELVPPSGDPIYANTKKDDYSFGFTVMWKWLHPDKATVWLSSNSLQGIEHKENGTEHARLILQYQQGVKLRVGT